MKTSNKAYALAGLITLLSFEWSGQAAITGQWDFKAANLAATIGSDLIFFDDGLQPALTFGTTTSLGISDIAGLATNVLHFPKFVNDYGAIYAYAGAAPNGGGVFVNHYTIIMDVLFPSGSSGKTRTLFRTDGASGTSGEISINAGNALAVVGGTASGGSVTPDVWHRIAVTVNATNSINLFVDGVKVASQATPGGRDGSFSIGGAIFLFNDTSTNTQAGYIASLQFQDEELPEGLIGALGAPTASGILTGPPPNPYTLSLSPTSDLRVPARSTISPLPLLQIELVDGTATVDTNTIDLKFNGVSVPASITRSAPNTTITYQVTNILASGSSNFVTLTYQDSATHNLGAQYAFHVGPYTALPADAAQALGSANTRGMVIRTVQASTTNDIPNVKNLSRAIQQLNGTLHDLSGALVPDLAIAGPNADGSYNVDTINFHLIGSDYGVAPGDAPFPGIPGNEGSGNTFACEVVTYLELSAGVHQLGVSVSTARTDVNDDDGYAVYVGPDARNILSPVIATFNRGTVASFANDFATNRIRVVAPVAGIYPFRLVYFQSGVSQANNDASFEFYSVDAATDENVLINDPIDVRAIKAYRVSTAPASNKPHVVEVSPAPGGSGVSPALPITALVIDDQTALDLASVRLYLNGVDFTASTTKNKVGTRTTLTYQPNATRSNPTNNVRLVFSDNSSPTPLSFTNDWSFTSSVTAGGQTTATGQWDFYHGDLSATIGLPLQYFTADASNTTAFGSCSSMGIPLIDGEDTTIMHVPGTKGAGSRNLAYIMTHGIAPNGGGTRVNQYTLIFDILLSTNGSGAGSLLQVTDPDVNTTDGDLFWQGNNFGQGTGGYNGTGTWTPGGWHRVIAAYDEAATPPVVTKYVDGIKQDDWTANQGLDNNRRAMLPTALLFADGDQDERREFYVSSIQVRDGKLTDAQMAALGGPSASKIPVNPPASTVAGQWDFDFGNLRATVGKALQYFTPDASNTTVFGTCSSLGVPLINGEDAKIMRVPGDKGAGSRNLAYIMDHGIKPNGGGTRVNQYTLIFDILLSTNGSGAGSLLQVTDPDVNTTDGDLFWQGNNFGQGTGGYNGTGTWTPGGWHRVIAAYDEAATPPVVTKFVDGIKQDDWTANQGLDNNRRSLLPTALLFADGDQDERREFYVNSIQIREGKLTDAEMVALGAPNGQGIPVATPQTTARGQWDFNYGDLRATVGKALQYFTPDASNATVFGSCSALGVPLIAGSDELIMKVSGTKGAGSRNLAYIMDHGIKPNGGGSRVNQYTLIFDILLSTNGSGAGSLLQVTDPDVNLTDGDLFWQGNNFGQGTGGYNGTGIWTPGGWHRVIAAYDEAAIPPVVTKFVDGIKQDDWTANQGLDNNRRTLLPTALLFADGDQDERREFYVNSIQIREGKLSDAEMMAMGGIGAGGVPVVVTVQVVQPPALSLGKNGNGTLTIAWPLSVTGYTLESSDSLAPGAIWNPEPGVVNNSVTVTIGPGPKFFRLHK